MGTIVVERIFDMFTMCFLLGVFLLARPLYASRFQVSAEAHASLRFWGFVERAWLRFFSSSAWRSIFSRFRPSR